MNPRGVPRGPAGARLFTFFPLGLLSYRCSSKSFFVGFYLGGGGGCGRGGGGVILPAGAHTMATIPEEDNEDDESEHTDVSAVSISGAHGLEVVDHTDDDEQNDLLDELPHEDPHDCDSEFPEETSEGESEPNEERHMGPGFWW